jgi:hypothetical protein
MGKYLDLLQKAERQIGATVSASDTSVERNRLHGTPVGRGQSGGATTLTTETTEAPRRRTVGLTCYSCRGQRFWISVYGVTVCAVCHPPVDPSFTADGGDGA